MFIDRKVELSKLNSAYHARKSGLKILVLLSGLRRIGKTVILQRFKEQMGHKALFLSCASLSTPYLSYRAIYEEILSLYCGDVSGLSTSLVASKVGGTGSQTLDTELGNYLDCREGRGNGRDMMEKFFKLPENYAVETKKHLIVILDEFQEMFDSLSSTLDFKGKGGQESLAWLARDIIQNQNHILWVFASSSISSTERFFKKHKAAFYGQGEEIKIEGFDNKAAKKFIYKLAQVRNAVVTENAVNLLYSLTGGFPILMEKLFFACGDEITKDRLESIIKDDLKQGYCNSFFAELFTALTKEATGGNVLNGVMHAVARGARRAGEVSKLLAIDHHYAYNLMKRLTWVGLLGSKNGLFNIRYPLMKEWLLLRPFPPMARESTDEMLRTELGIGFESRVRETFMAMRKVLRIDDNENGDLLNSPNTKFKFGPFTNVKNCVRGHFEYDLLATSKGETIIGECKFTRSKVEVKDVLRFQKKIEVLGFKFKNIKPLIISASGFSQGAIEKAHKFGIVTMNLAGLNELASKAGMKRFASP